MKKIVVFSLISSIIFISLFAFSEEAYAYTWRNRTISSLSPGCTDDISSDDTNPNDDDTDKDGICDKWEGKTNFQPDWPTGTTYSANCADIDGCPVVGVRDIYLEIDYMDGHIPDQVAIDLVKRAFEEQTDPSYRLHIVVDEMVLPHIDTTRFPGFNTATGWGFDQIKQCHFGTLVERGGTSSDPQCGWANANNRFTKKAIFHYALFVHAQAANPTSSGIAELFGNDLMISLGAFTDGVGNTDEQAGTLLHEIGHNLNLRHGGNDDINCKPNYLSVMSYSRQFKNLDSERKLDFSRDDVTVMGGNPLHESGGLNEPAGLSRYDNGNEQRVVYGPILPPELPTTGGMVIDWDMDGDTTAGSEYQSTANVNSLPGCPLTEPNDSLNSYDDWTGVNLRFTLSGVGYSDGATSETALGGSTSRIVSGAIFDEGSKDDKSASSVIKEGDDDIKKETVIEQHVLRITSLECFLNLEVDECESSLGSTFEQNIALKAEYVDSVKPQQRTEMQDQQKKGLIVNYKNKLSMNPTDDELYAIHGTELDQLKKETLTKTANIKKVLEQSLNKVSIDSKDLISAIDQLKSLKQSLNNKLNGEYAEMFSRNIDDISKSYKIAATVNAKHILLDPDGDGIKGAADLCPQDAEDFDGDQDTDGCPDKTGGMDTLWAAIAMMFIIIGISITTGMISIRRQV